DMWVRSRLSASGVVTRHQDIVDDDDTSQVNLVFKSDIPECLRDKTSAVKTAMIQDVNVAVLDPSSDMAVIARKGCESIKALRKQKTRMAATDIAGTQGSAIGKLVQEDEEEEAQERGRGGDDRDKGYGQMQAKNKDDALSRAEIKRVRESLPIAACRDHLVELVKSQQILIVEGATGSGKTTQLGQYLLDAGLAKHGMIAVTQPRRIAAVSVAARVSDERGVKCGESEVGYTIRFEDKTCDKTKLRFLTDGVLLRACLTDPNLEQYSCVIIDEAHERALNSDVLLGLLKMIVGRRSDLRVIITSATLDSEQFAKFFNNVMVFRIPGRTYPVEVFHSRSPKEDYAQAAVDQCARINAQDGDGDVLVFATGQGDVEGIAEMLRAKLQEKLAEAEERCQPLPRTCLVLPMYSQLRAASQAEIFRPAPKGCRKIVIATNIAETSLTIDGIRFVVDCGYCKLKVYNPKLGIDSLPVVPISRFSANQRAGRAGRTAPGICYRLYTEYAYKHHMFNATVPEIKRSSLANVVLNLATLDQGDPTLFPFLDAPPPTAIREAQRMLWRLGALNDNGGVTARGKLMCRFPVEPPLSRMILASVSVKDTNAKGRAEREREKNMGLEHLPSPSVCCVDDVCTVAAMLSVQKVFETPYGKEEEARRCHEKFAVPESDHLTLLNVFQLWSKKKHDHKWIRDHYLHNPQLKKALEVRTQLLELVDKLNLPRGSTEDWDVVRQAISSGYIHHVAFLKGLDKYVNLINRAPCQLHPSSALQGMAGSARYVIYHEVMHVAQGEYMSVVGQVDPLWIRDYAQNQFDATLYTGNGQMQELPALPEGNEEEEWERQMQSTKASSHLSSPLGP
ncbi:hypothetical protein KIPB_006091, partial [Kipferlia bialata]